MRCSTVSIPLVVKLVEIRSIVSILLAVEPVETCGNIPLL